MNNKVTKAFLLKRTFLIKMEDQIRIANTLDLSIVLGGEGKEKTRSNHAHKIYNKTDKEKKLDLILTGHKSVLEELSAVPESIIMYHHLLYLGLPEEILHTETKSSGKIRLLPS